MLNHPNQQPDYLIAQNHSQIPGWHHSYFSWYGHSRSNVAESDAKRKNHQGKLASMEKWYVAHSKPRNEELLWKQFCLRNFESYYPRLNVKTVNPRARKVQPYFPGYLFVRVDLDVTGRSIIEWMPGGIGLVSFGDEPAYIPDSLVNALKQRIESLVTVPAENPVAFSKGDHIFINEGVFRGYEAIFDNHFSGTDRVRVLLSLLDNRQIPVELPASCIQRSDQN